MGLRLLVVDSHPVWRAGVIASLAPLAYEIREAESSASARSELRIAPSDVALIDCRLGGDCGFTLLSEVRSAYPTLTVVMTTSLDHPLFLLEAERRGASGFVTKDQPVSTFESMLRAAAAGGKVFTREQGFRMNSAANVPRLGIEYDVSLTEREVGILRCVSRSTNQKIAEELGISAETVKEHVQKILAKIGVADRTQAVCWAIRQGIITL